MSTSGSVDYGLVTNTIVEEACDLCGIGSEGEAISADIYARARRSLNLIVKTWQTSDHLWLRTEASVTLVASQGNYVLSTLFSVKPGRVLGVRRRTSSIDTPLTEWSREEYDAQPNKTTEGVPVAFYYDPQRAAGTLYVWPEPSTATAADTTLRVTYVRRIEDFDNTNDDPDLPQEWTQALCYALAAELALKYGVRPDRLQEINNRAAMLKAQLDSWDTEPASLFLQPANQC